MNTKFAITAVVAGVVLLVTHGIIKNKLELKRFEMDGRTKAEHAARAYAIKVVRDKIMNGDYDNVPDRTAAMEYDHQFAKMSYRFEN